MKKITLPNGIGITAFNKLETDVLYHEIFETRSYFKHGITVGEGDVIFDVGANIGMFTIYMGKKFKRLTIHAFEPVNDMFQMLEYNCHNSIPNKTAAVICHPYGLSDKNKSATFQFSTVFSMTSGMYKEQLDENSKNSGKILDWLKAITHDLFLIGKISLTCRRTIVALLSVPIINMVILLISLIPFLVLLIRIKSSMKQVDCRLKTFREVLNQEHIDYVHLVKIDVEGSELDVLNGMGEKDWEKLKQLVIEVHDINHRVKTISAMLASKGYTVVADQEDWHLHKLMRIYTLYARRLN